jgi:hypothetical protein
MGTFEVPTDLLFNRGVVRDPVDYARTRGVVGWLCLTGDEFAAMPGGISYAEVERAVEESAQVVSDPPRTLNLDLARQHVAALDRLPRPSLVTCRTGPRASAVAYMYGGLRNNADADDVLAAADRDEAPFCPFPEYREWVRTSMEALRADKTDDR